MGREPLARVYPSRYASEISMVETTFKGRWIFTRFTSNYVTLISKYSPQKCDDRSRGLIRSTRRNRLQGME